MNTIKLSKDTTLYIGDDGNCFIKRSDGSGSIDLTRDETEALWRALDARFTAPVTEEEVRKYMENPPVLSREDEEALAKAKVRLFKQLGIKP